MVDFTLQSTIRYKFDSVFESVFRNKDEQFEQL